MEREEVLEAYPADSSYEHLSKECNHLVAARLGDYPSLGPLRNHTKTSLSKKIEGREALVSVIGLGYAGLPLAVAFAEAGFPVIGIDIDEERVSSLNGGHSYIPDISDDQVSPLIEKGRLKATADYDALLDADAILICVPTPLSKTRDPDLSYVKAALEGVERRLHPQTLIVLESTTYPGTVEEMVLPLIEGNGYKVGEEVYLAYSPERIDPGRKDYTISNTPKVVGGITERCLEMAVTLYSQVIERIVPVSSTRTAEMVKLLENTFRAVNIALANEFALMCDRLGVDVWEVIEAASTKPYGFMPFSPGPGLGGHCVPIDPLYLAWKLKTFNYNARLIQLATEINSYMPYYVLEKIVYALNEEGKPLKGSQILILGVTYKRDVSDTRESPALDLIRLLRERGAEVSYHDPYVPLIDIDGTKMRRKELNAETLRESDCVVIVADHSLYDWDWIAEHSRLIVDTRNATKRVRANPSRIVKL